MIDQELPQKISELLQPILAESALELVELNIKRRGRTIVVEIFADRAQGGISIESCSRVNRQISRQIEERNLIGDDYEVEVSSPGIDRPLKSAKDFLRTLGRPVRFHLKEKIDNKFEYTGIVQDVLENNVMLVLPSTTKVIPLDKINKAIQVIE